MLLSKRPSLIPVSSTGGASGFGKAICERFAEEGAKVILSDINAEGGEKVASTNKAFKFVKADATSASDWKTLVSEAKSTFGRLDFVINNAGTSYKNKPTIEVTEAEFDRVFAVNVKSIYQSVIHCMPFLIEQGQGGVMVNVASIGALRPRGGLVWYNATKGAVFNATKGLASEYAAHKIRVNGICPLLSATGLFSMFTGLPDTEENRAKFLSNVPLGRLTDPVDVANAAVYFCSDEASFITGANLEVDGGRAIA
jgi:NAD(P)-dependent dehydrogenase (short-subunit alcohol dehydrogenase family)